MTPELLSYIRVFLYLILVITSVSLAYCFHCNKDGTIRKLLIFQNIALSLMLGAAGIAAANKAHIINIDIIIIHYILTIPLFLLFVAFIRLIIFTKQWPFLEYGCVGIKELVNKLIISPKDR